MKKVIIFTLILSNSFYIHIFPSFFLKKALGCFNCKEPGININTQAEVAIVPLLEENNQEIIQNNNPDLFSYLAPELVLKIVGYLDNKSIFKLMMSSEIFFKLYSKNLKSIVYNQIAKHHAEFDFVGIVDKKNGNMDSAIKKFVFMNNIGDVEELSSYYIKYLKECHSRNNKESFILKTLFSQPTDKTFSCEAIDLVFDNNKLKENYSCAKSLRIRLYEKEEEKNLLALMFPKLKLSQDPIKDTEISYEDFLKFLEKIKNFSKAEKIIIKKFNQNKIRSTTFPDILDNIFNFCAKYNVIIQDENGFSLLHYLSDINASKQQELTNILKTHQKYIKKNLELKNKSGYTPLHRILLNERKESNISTLLIQYGANVNSFNNDGKVALHTILENKFCADRTKKIFTLIENGANVNAKDDSGNTPLHYCSSDDITTIQVLLNSCANIEKNKAGKTLLDTIQ